MFNEKTVFNSDHIGRNESGNTPVSGEASVDDHIIPFRHDQAVLVTQTVRKTAHEIEQSGAPRCDMGTVLDVCVWPEAGCCVIIAFVEQGIECLKHKYLILGGRCFGHMMLSMIATRSRKVR